MSQTITRVVNRIGDKITAVSHGVESVLINRGVKQSLCTTIPSAIEMAPRLLNEPQIGTSRPNDTQPTMPVVEIDAASVARLG
ncbi:hypothetical protein [Buttiauxella izardii]|nr:hypothetical protein [Buttiauxella izardii]